LQVASPRRVPMKPMGDLPELVEGAPRSMRPAREAMVAPGHFALHGAGPEFGKGEPLLSRRRADPRFKSFFAALSDTHTHLARLLAIRALPSTHRYGP